MTNKINVFISTKNHPDASDDKSKLNITIPDSLLSVRENEHFIMRLMNFYCYNTFYNITSNNNIIRVDYVVYYLPIGNPSILDIRDNLNTQLNALGITVSYNKILNKLVFSNSTITLKRLDIQNSGVVLGFNDNTTYNINANSSVTSIYPISVIGNNAVNISMGGDIEFLENNLDNLRNGGIQTNNIIFQKLIDTKSNCLISYENYGDNSYEYKLNNTDSINYFTINILDENLNYLTDISEWSMVLQFEKVNKHNISDTLLKIQESLFDIINLIFSGLRYYKIM